MSAAPGIAPHVDLQALRRETAAHAVWFAAPPEACRLDVDAGLAERIRIHRHGPVACLTVDDLAPSDLAALRRVSRFALVRQPQAASEHFFGIDLVGALDRQGFKVFFAHGAAGSATLATHSRIGTLEFLASRSERLAAYPTLSSGRTLGDGRVGTGAARAVFLLDLIQDFEILRPILARAAPPFGPLQPVVAVTERVLASQIWEETERYLAAMGVPWFKPLGPADVAAALGTDRSVLLTASESSAPGHAFGHQACRSAPPRALRVTFQHGYECVGLRHHRAHDLQFPQGVRFASDIIFGWRRAADLPNLHPADRDKCIAVGVTKTSAERSAAWLEAEWAERPLPEPAGLASREALVVAENLHSVRFTSPQRYQRFLRFIEEAHAAPGLRIVVRSHPGKRTLELARASNPYAFLAGSLTADHFFASRGLVSPPSTVLLDAAMCARPSAVWTDSRVLGDAENYADLPAVTNVDDLDDAILSDPSGRGLAAYRWAVDNSAALNGIPAAWGHLCHLMT